MKRTLLTIALSAFASVASAQQLGGSDLGQTAPTPGPSDISQLLTNGDTVALPDTGSLNNFYDNTANSAGYVGSSFTTGTNASGYTMTSLALKFGGGQPVGYAGGADTTLAPGWIISIYQLSGTGNTNAAGIYTNTVGTLAGTNNTGGDWIQMTGFNQKLLPNTVYAWTIFSSGYDDLGYATNKPYTNGTICQIPPGGGFVTYAADKDSATFDVGLTVGTPQLGGADLGSTPPTPGASDAAQLLTTGDTTALNGPGPLNAFYDNTAIGSHSSTGYVGSSFTTGANPGGYSMTSLALKFGGGGTVGYAGGADTTLDPGWIISLYQLSGTGATNATAIYTNTVGQLAGTANTGADWIKITGFSQKLLPNTVYAWTIFSSGYDDLAYATGTPYAGGAICEIPPGGGAVTYYPTVADSATFDVGLSPIVLPLGGTDLGSTPPTPGASDAAQLLTTGDTTALNGPGPLNAFYDNTAIGSHSSTGYVGSSFTTGANPGGYTMSSLALKFGGGQPVGYAGGADTTLNPGWTISVYQLSGTGATNATAIYTNTVGQLAGTTNTGADWVVLTGFFGINMLANTVYAWTIFSSGYDDLAYATNTPYAGGAICEIPPGGGAVTYYPTVADSATFDVGLTLAGYPAVGVGTATPNPAYGLSPLALTNTASGPGTLSYQWQTNSDLSGGLGGTWANIPNATNLTLAMTVPNLSGTLDFHLIVTNAAGSVTSAPVALTVKPAQAPVSLIGVTPTSIMNYVGSTVSFSDTSFVGTMPMTYQWQASTGSGFTNIPNATNTTLTLTNVQAAGAGYYQLVAMNSQGTNSDNGTQIGLLTLLAAPAAPVATTPPNVPYLQFTNAPLAYWRLQETGNPANAPPAVLAYDYSGHGIYATYGVGVGTGLAGPQPPTYPGFASTELAAATSSAISGYLTVPPLNLTSNAVTFLAWINPSGPQSGATGLFFTRNGSDASGFGFNANANAAGMPCLGFTWNNNSATDYGWNSGLYPVAGDWSLVAYVITPTNETTYLYYVDTTVTPYTTNFFQSVLTGANTTEKFSTTSYLGADTQQTAGRSFNGSIAEAAIYTNSLSQQEVLSIFLAGINSTNAPVSPPQTLPSPSIFTGETIQLNGTAGGSAPITYQWKCSANGVTWSNVPANANYSGMTSATLQISNATLANALSYEVVAKNSSSTATSAVATVTVTAVPAGLWTMNFQLTNDTLGFATSASGGGQYAGQGVLGTGTYWNCFVDTVGAFAAGTFTTASDFLDDGVTHSGIFASVNGDNDSTLTTAAGAGSISTLLDQFVYNATALTFTGVPDGTYSLIIYGVDGGFANGNDAYTVNGTSQLQASLQNDQAGYFSQGGNSELFTNVQVAGGTLSVSVGGAGGEYNANINGAQLQLISYAASASTNSLEFSVTNKSMTFTFPEGSLQTATNLLGPWVSIPDPSPATVVITNKIQFFRLKIPAP